jgi:hypothetical protein
MYKLHDDVELWNKSISEIMVFLSSRHNTLAILQKSAYLTNSFEAVEMRQLLSRITRAPTSFFLP